MSRSDATNMKTEYMKMSPLERWLLYAITFITIVMIWT
jgi:hypothetical protein